MTTLKLVRYRDLAPTWPASGEHILAQYDEDSIVVYQAYKPSIGRFAAEHGRFGGEWPKPHAEKVPPTVLWRSVARSIHPPG